MALLTVPLIQMLRANDMARIAAERAGHLPPDPVPVVKLFNPRGFATWLAAELADDGDTLFGLADLGFGCPELGSFSLFEIARLTLPRGRRIERDRSFVSTAPLSAWAETARKAGSIICAEQLLLGRSGDKLPS